MDLLIVEQQILSVSALTQSTNNTRKRLLRPDMTEYLFTWGLSKKQKRNENENHSRCNFGSQGSVPQVGVGLHQERQKKTPAGGMRASKGTFSSSTFIPA